MVTIELDQDWIKITSRLGQRFLVSILLSGVRGYRATGLPVGGHHEPLYLHVDRLHVALHLLPLSLVVLAHDLRLSQESCYLVERRGGEGVCVERVCGLKGGVG